MDSNRPTVKSNKSEKKLKFDFVFLFRQSMKVVCDQRPDSRSVRIERDCTGELISPCNCYRGPLHEEFL